MSWYEAHSAVLVVKSNDYARRSKSATTEAEREALTELASRCFKISMLFERCGELERQVRNA